MSYIKSNEFVELVYEAEFNLTRIAELLTERYPSYDVRPERIRNRIANYRRKGLLPLDSGNSISLGEQLKSTSTLYDSLGNVKMQWVKSDVPKQEFLAAYEEAISSIASTLPALPLTPPPSTPLMADLATLYISNDVHFGALAWDKESGSDWNVELASATLRSAYDYLFSCSPAARVGIVVDLGDLLEVDDFKNMTPISGNILAVDSRYPKVLQLAYESLIYGINLALAKHELVHFYNISGK